MTSGKYIRTEKTKRNMSIAKQKMSNETRKKLRENHKGSLGKHWKLSKEQSNAISIRNKGRIVTEETKQKLRINHSGGPKVGHIVTEETKRKAVETMRIKKENGYINPFINKTYEEKFGIERAKEIKEKQSNAKKNKTYEERYGEEIANEVKKKQRNSAIDYIIKTRGQCNPNKGIHENFILDELEKLYNYKIIRQFRTCGYKVDGYIKELNLCIEVDEPTHFDFNGNLKGEDIKRQKEIEQELNCKFLRVKDRF